jgi:hypothetical protein
MPPLKHLVGIYSMLSRHSRDRRTGYQRGLNDPALLLRCTSQPLRGPATNLHFDGVTHNVSIGLLTLPVHTAKARRLPGECPRGDAIEWTQTSDAEKFRTGGKWKSSQKSLSYFGWTGLHNEDGVCGNFDHQGPDQSRTCRKADWEQGHSRHFT